MVRRSCSWPCADRCQAGPRENPSLGRDRASGEVLSPQGTGVELCAYIQS
jgi:hypothetical protein